jgi:DNA polymerase-3 subunit alpha
MLAPRFVHLRLHSEYSITDGMVRLDVGKNHECPPVARAAADAMPAVALTDLANLFGMVKFYSAARAAGVKPIVGADVWVGDPESERPARLLLLVRNRSGYLRLCELLTQAYLGNRRQGRPEISLQALADADNGGLIALSGGQWGDVGEALLAGNSALAAQRARQWGSLFPGSYYLEVSRFGQAQQETLVGLTADLAGDLQLPLVATHPVQFVDREDFDAHEARVCIAEGYVLGDTRRPRHYTAEQYFKSQDEMVDLFADLPEALANSVEIAKRCNLELMLGKACLPDFPTPAGMTIDEYLVAEARVGLEKRLTQLFPDESERKGRRAEYEERLAFECQTIVQMGFPGYFLIVADFINWAKQNGVPVGPGRGSGAGSLVAYSLGITDLDPLAYALLFERFLNPERVSMPDFDVDFCQDNRWRVIDYVRRKYGEQAVSQIATFGTMSSKAVVRDVGRVLELPYSLCDRISKLIPVVQNKPVSLTEALEQEPQLKEMLADEHDGEALRELFALASKLEDMARNVGMHAGGVLIAPGKLTDFCPLYQQDTRDAVPVSQFDKDDVEKVGLVKFDFLGLRNLTIIQLAVDYIERLSGERIDLLSLSFDDPSAYQILKDANTTAIFQVESEGMKKLLKKLEPDRFEDIIAVLALYRPGPLGSGMVDDFILRKKGRQSIDYFHPDLKASLEPTYGVIVYQEQVMQISQIIGGYTLGGADMLRRAMGKKKPEEMAKHRTTIAAGAAQKNYDPALAEQLFDLMTKFAEYGFNKSHTAAYAVVTYQTAWLKAHHTAAFMAATLSSDMDNTDAVKGFIDDTLRNRVAVLGPDINASAYRFVPVDRETIRYGLGAVKGTGESAVVAILEARSAGPFGDLFDFCRRVDKRQVNRRAIEALIRAGAFDSLDPHRARLLASVGIALDAAEQAARDALQGGLFDGDGEQPALAPALVEIAEWDQRQRLLEEKAALGFYFSGHLYDSYRDEVSRWVRGDLSKLDPRKESVAVAGVVADLRMQMTRRGKMAVATLEDGRGQIEVTIFSELFDAIRDRVRVDQPLIVEGKVSRDDFRDGLRLVADRVMSLAEGRGRFAKALRLSLNGKVRDAGAADRLRRELGPFVGGDCPVRLVYRNETASCELSMGPEWQVRLEDELLAGLRSWLSAEAVEIL